MSIRPFSFAEKCYAGTVAYYGAVQISIYFTDGVGFLLGFGVGVWVCLVCVSVLFAFLGRNNVRWDSSPDLSSNRGGYP